MTFSQRLREANDDFVGQIRLLVGYCGNQKLFASRIGMVESTFSYRLAHPYSFRLDELRRMKSYADKHSLPFDPLRIVP